MKDLFTVNVWLMLTVAFLLVVAVVFVGGLAAALLTLVATVAGSLVGVWVGEARTIKELNEVVMELQDLI